MSGAQSTGVHLAFSNGYQGVHQAFSYGPHRGREDLNTHNVIGMASHMLVAAKFVVGPRPRAQRQNKSKNVSFEPSSLRP